MLPFSSNTWKKRAQDKNIFPNSGNNKNSNNNEPGYTSDLDNTEINIHFAILLTFITEEHL